MEIPLKHNGIKHLPPPKGPYAVGCTDVMIGQSTSDNGCFFRLHYPCELTTESIFESSSRWANWMPHPKYADGYATVVGITPMIGRRIFNWVFGNFWIPTIVDAQPLKDQKFPVIIFSHGLTGCRTAYSVICSELSSHGFIVAAMEHRDGSACMSYNLFTDPDKKSSTSVEDWIHYKPMVFEKEDMPLRQEQLQSRIRECQRALDNLLKINEGAEDIGQHLTLSSIDLPNFKGTMDFSNPVIAGHSFGSATVLRTLAVEKRFKIGVALDAWMWPIKDETQLPEAIEQPVLFINMEAFQTLPNLKTMKKFTADVEHTERRVVTIKGSVHKNQVDLPFMVPPYLRRWLGLHSTIDPHLAMDLNNRITLLYLRKHLGHSVVEEHSEFVEKHKDFIFEGIP